MESVRQPAVAGTFYPRNPRELAQTIDTLLAGARSDAPAPKAIIAPHAGYIYSGAVAARVYARVRNGRDSIHRVILLGPSHRVPLRGIAACSAPAYLTPLGEVSIDREAVNSIAPLKQVQLNDQAHAFEHSLEVHLPFLQRVLDEFTLVPLVVGEARPEEVHEVLNVLWGGAETLIVVSSDLSHYHDYATAQRLDRATSEAIVELLPDRIRYEDACGRNPVSGLLLTARLRGLHAELIDLRNSGDTAGPKDHVVGYGAYAFDYRRPTVQ